MDILGKGSSKSSSSTESITKPAAELKSGRCYLLSTYSETCFVRSLVFFLTENDYKRLKHKKFTVVASQSSDRPKQ